MRARAPARRGARAGARATAGREREDPRAQRRAPRALISRGCWHERPAAAVWRARRIGARPLAGAARRAMRVRRRWASMPMAISRPDADASPASTAARPTTITGKTDQPGRRPILRRDGNRARASCRADAEHHAAERATPSALRRDDSRRYRCEAFGTDVAKRRHRPRTSRARRPVPTAADPLARRRLAATPPHAAADATRSAAGRATPAVRVNARGWRTNRPKCTSTSAASKSPRCTNRSRPYAAAARALEPSQVARRLPRRGGERHEHRARHRRSHRGAARPAQRRPGQPQRQRRPRQQRHRQHAAAGSRRASERHRSHRRSICSCIRSRPTPAGATKACRRATASGRTRLSNPPLALDLHYLLSAYSAAICTPRSCSATRCSCCTRCRC